MNNYPSCYTILKEKENKKKIFIDIAFIFICKWEKENHSYNKEIQFSSVTA